MIRSSSSSSSCSWKQKVVVVGALFLTLAILSTWYINIDETTTTTSPILNQGANHGHNSNQAIVETGATIQQVNNLVAPPTADEHKLLILKIQQDSNCSTITTTASSVTSSQKFGLGRNDNNNRKHKPIWVPSFPGSGAELFRELITGITLKPTVDGALKDVCMQASTSKDSVVTCKTHWPTLNYSSKFQDPKHKHFKKYYSKDVIVLIRNPMNAIPSWYNQIYETRTTQTYHSKGAPLKSWNKWMVKHNQIFAKVQQWRDMILFWLNQDNPEDNDNGVYYKVAAFVPFESLIDTTTGPSLIANLIQPVLQKNGVDTLEDIQCIWKYCVVTRSDMKRSHGTNYHPGFLSGHQRMFLDAIDKVTAAVVAKLKRHVDDQNFLEPLQLLLDTLHNYRKRIEDHFVLVQYNHT